MHLHRVCMTEKGRATMLTRLSFHSVSHHILNWWLLNNCCLLQQENPAASSHFQLSQVKNEELFLQSDSMTETSLRTQPADMTHFHDPLLLSPTRMYTHPRTVCTYALTYTVAHVHFCKKEYTQGQKESMHVLTHKHTRKSTHAHANLTILLLRLVQRRV